MIAIVVPAHNEEQTLGPCLEALQAASTCADLQGERVLQIVVLDACTDGSASVARRWSPRTLVISARNVGVARAVGAAFALQAGARWLAFTDADSVVAPDWLSKQLALGCDVVCGTIGVQDWGTYGQAMKDHFAATYTDADGHTHVHGANLGVSAAAYRKAGGFAPLASSEDVALVAVLKAQGARIAWSAAPRVTTSARRHFRAPGGFGETLRRVEQAAGGFASPAAA